MAVVLRWGVTVEGVRHLIPAVPIRDTSTPSEGDVEEYLEQIGGTVAARIGELDVEQFPGEADTPAGRRRLRLVAQAKLAVLQEAASYVAAAGLPQKASTDPGNLASWWHARYLETLETLEGLVDELDPGPGAAGADQVHADALYSFPPSPGYGRRF